MIELMFLAFGTGFLLSFGFGSVFFALIQSSIDYGFKAGRNLAFGVALSDVLLVTLALLGTGFLPDIPNFNFYARCVGVLLLLGLGVSQFSKVRISTSVIESGLKNKLYFIGKGGLLNVVNPVNFLAWVVVSTTLKTYKYTLEQEVLFFGICILTVFFTESFIAYFANKIKAKFSENIIKRTKYLTGSIFFGISIKLFIDIYKEF